VSTDQVIPPPATALPLPPPYDRPDWDAIHETITCPLCGYELRGLTDPLCPECGYRFHWPDLLDPTRRVHPWLFEHHPRHNLWSFAKTLVRNFQPGKFWTHLHPGQPSKPKRLVMYWVPGAVLTMLPAAILLFDHWQTNRPWFATAPGSLSVLSQLLQHDNAVRGALFACLLAALFPWTTFLTLLIFQQSMGRAKIKTHHVLRCAVYSGDVILWAGLLGSGAVFWWVLQPWRWRVDDRVMMMLIFIAAAAILLNLGRLVSAYRNYLKFDHATATVLVAQLIVLLASMTLFIEAIEFL